MNINNPTHTQTFIGPCPRFLLKSWDFKASKGEDANPHEFPFQAAIVNAYTGTFTCAGAIIDTVRKQLKILYQSKKSYLL